MKISIFSFVSFALAAASAILTAELLLNRSATGSASDTLFYYINPCVAGLAVVLSIIGIVRKEKRKIIGVVAIVLSLPGLWIGGRIVLYILGLMIHGDT